MNLRKLIFTNNACYKAGRKIKPKGIMVHSTGANNPNLRSMWVQMMDSLVRINIIIIGIKIDQMADKSAFMPLLASLRMGLSPLIKPCLGTIGGGMQVVMLTIRI